MKIRVKPVVPWITHGWKGRPMRESYPNVPRSPEDCILIIGAPKEPKPGSWICDTDVIWPVLAIEHAGGITEIDDDRYVCRHQIIAGD
jgi:hypothetical protein